MDHLSVDLKKKQRIIVIFTKSDLLREKLSPKLANWLKGGGQSWYALDLNQKLADLSMSSLMVEEWVRDTLKCARFINMASDNFREVRYTVVSALGAEFDEGENPEPLRVLDPFLWLLIFAREELAPVEPEKISFWKKFFARFRSRGNQPRLGSGSPQS